MNTRILSFASFILGFCHLQNSTSGNWGRGVMRVCDASCYILYAFKISNCPNFVNLGTPEGWGVGGDLVRVNLRKDKMNFWDIGRITVGSGDPPVPGGRAAVLHPCRGRGKSPHHPGWGRHRVLPRNLTSHRATLPPGTAPGVTSLNALKKIRLCSVKGLLTELLSLSNETREDVSLSLNFINMTSDHIMQHTFLTASKKHVACIWGNHIPHNTSIHSLLWYH